MKGRITPRKELLGLPKTVHGGQAWRTEGVEDYSHNLNPFGPPECLAETVLSALEGVGHYPDDSCAELKDVISKAFDVAEESIIVGAGSSDIIRCVPNTFFERGDRVVIPCPSFAEYTQQCRIVGAQVDNIELRPEDDFRIDADELLRRAVGAKAVYICNPNNPTGRIEPKDKLVRIVRECEDMGVLVFLDETLLELVPGFVDNTLSGMVSRFNNLVVASSLTKSYAIPGIRIGFGMASPDLAESMNKVRMTWNVGQVEQAVAIKLLRDCRDHVDHAAGVMAEESEAMNSALREIGFPAGDVSDSFFYFNSLESIGMDAPEFKARMMARGIAVRDCSSFGPQFSKYVRYSVKDKERNCRFVAAVDSVLNG